MKRFLAAVLGFVALAFAAPAFAASIPYCNTPLDTIQAAINTCVIVPVNSQLVVTGGGNLSTAITVPIVASPVNLIQITPGATGTAPIINVGGASVDTNVGLTLAGNGTGAVLIGGTTTTLAGLQVAQTASRVNDIVITPAATGTAPTIVTGGAGVDANRNIGIAGSGTGLVILGQTICTVTGATPQTCNGQRGIVTTGTLVTAAVTNAAYVINNSSVTASSLISCSNQGYSGTPVTNGEPVFLSCVPGSGTITVNITNVHASNALNGTIQIGFAVLN